MRPSVFSVQTPQTTSNCGEPSCLLGPSRTGISWHEYSPSSVLLPSHLGPNPLLFTYSRSSLPCVSFLNLSRPLSNFPPPAHVDVPAPLFISPSPPHPPPTPTDTIHAQVQPHLQATSTVYHMPSPSSLTLPCLLSVLVAS